jgi:hypothetical protein
MRTPARSIKQNLLAMIMAGMSGRSTDLETFQPTIKRGNKYHTPHQGAQEKARRLRQRERGWI